MPDQMPPPSDPAAAPLDSSGHGHEPRPIDPRFDLVISKGELEKLAPALLASLREFVGYGLCKQTNTWERKILAEQFRKLAVDALKEFPDLKLNHMGARTEITE